MARIERFRIGGKERYHRHDVVEAEVYFFVADDGEGFVQIDTFGSGTRQDRGKVSQSIQMSLATFEDLGRLVRSHGG